MVDINGKKILPFEFQKVAIYQDLKVIAGLKEDLWGLYTLDGKVILVLKTAKKQRYGEMLEVLHEKSQRWRYLSKDISIPLLISINDYSSNVSYIVNPQYPQGQYPKLKRSFDNTDNIVRNSDFTFSKLFRVVESDDKINFINEKGAKLYENGSDDGFVISDDLIAASEGEKYALHEPDKKQSDHLYSKVYLHLHLWNFTYLSM